MRALKRIWIVPVVLVLCASCATLSPERRYLGEWSGTHEGETYTALFEKNHKCVISAGDEGIAGDWTVKDEAVTIVSDEVTLDGFLTSQDELILSAGGIAVPFKKVK